MQVLFRAFYQKIDHLEFLPVVSFYKLALESAYRELAYRFQQSNLDGLLIHRNCGCRFLAYICIEEADPRFLVPFV